MQQPSRDRKSLTDFECQWASDARMQSHDDTTDVHCSAAGAAEATERRESSAMPKIVMLIRLLLLLLAVADSSDFTQQLDVHAQCRDWPDRVGECKLVRGIAALATALGNGVSYKTWRSE